MKLDDNGIYLKILSPDDVGPDYMNWMHDAAVNQYLESRWRTFTIEDLKDFVMRVNQSEEDVLFGIFLSATVKHIGNIKIGRINHLHRFADVGLIIGDKKSWGKGFGTSAVSLATEYAFKELNLNKLIAGIYKGNVGSYKAFERAGYREVGVLKNHRFCQGEYVDEFLMEICFD